MRAIVLAEDSGTTRDEGGLTFADFYEGAFLSVSGLAEALSQVCETDLYILTERFGLVEGSQSVDDHEPVSDSDHEISEAASEKLRAEVPTADVVVVLLTRGAFEDVVVDRWDELVESAKPGSVWCLGASRSAIESVDLERLEAKDCTVLTYERVGVARIDTETREELLEAVRQKAPA